MAVSDDPSQSFSFTTLRPGALIITVGSANKSGLVDIQYEEKTYAAFMRDIEDRCERVRTVSD